MSLRRPPLPPDAAAFDDPDNPEWTDETFARARPAEAVLSPEVLAVFRRGRGRPRKADAKELVTLRLDPRVVRHFKARGKGWQAHVNDLLLREAERETDVARR